MSASKSPYFSATRHPWPCVLFVLPLLIIYEVGVETLAAGQSDACRNGADTWIRWLLSQIGLSESFLPGIFIGSGLLVWAWCAVDDPPKEMGNIWMGMVIESAVFAVLLWGASFLVMPMFEHLPLATPGEESSPTARHAVCFLGAGIYEEVVFRLILLSLLYYLFQLGDLSGFTSTLLAVVISSLVFAAAHHIGQSGENFNGLVFLFRALAGVYFAILLRWRGFGIAVGAHAGYDILVGLVLPSV